MLCLRAGYNHGSLGQEHNSRDGVGGLRSRELARRVPDEVVDGGLSPSLPGNVAGMATRVDPV
jgi:hypothetical protein